jgi:hypothetical protein
MVPVHSKQPRRGYLAKLTYWALIATIIFTTNIFARATAHKLLDSRLATKNFLSGLFTTKQNKKLEAALLASLLGQTDKSIAKHSTTDNSNIDVIVKGMEILYQQMDQVLTRIDKSNHKTRKLAEQLARSPRALKTIKDLDAAIARFTPNKPIVDY